ncbi:MAG: sugar ABC transporter ATP-binding protein [Planctomycetota bacterium]|jgi:ribose transport system ATP-binding protein|nr:sugar ABC transporter ATP-binding protein [Planctomycetota bacterium]
MPEPLLDLANIDKSYGGNPVLRRVSMDLLPGEVHCLVGENGAGKSTFIKILSGAVRPDGGTLRLAGGSYSSLSPQESMRLGVSTIYQDIELIESLTVADNIFLGHELPAGIPGTVNIREQERRAGALLDMLRIRLDPGEPVENLSTAQKQNLQIAKAMHGEARILVMDEPTVSLGVDEKKALMRLVRELRAKGLGIIYISHFLEEVFDIGDRITILKDGEKVGTYDVAAMTADKVTRLMVGRDASQFFSRERSTVGETRFEVSGLSCEGVEDVSFSVARGEVFGFGGLVGSGRTELAEALFGARKRLAGTIILDGEKLAPASPLEALRDGVCLLTEDRKRLALFMNRPLSENVTVAHNELFGGALLSFALERAQVADMLAQLKIVAAGTDIDAASLSGGNQQKVAVARWLLCRSEVLIFDEPTKGVDIGAKAEIYRLMTDLAAAGRCVIMISSDMPELIAMSDRIGVMRGGRLAGILPGAKAREEELIRMFMG